VKPSQGWGGRGGGVAISVLYGLRKTATNASIPVQTKWTRLDDEKKVGGGEHTSVSDYLTKGHQYRRNKETAGTGGVRGRYHRKEAAERAGSGKERGGFPESICECRVHILAKEEGIGRKGSGEEREGGRDVPKGKV